MKTIIRLILFVFIFQNSYASQHYINSSISCDAFATTFKNIELKEGVEVLDLKKPLSQLKGLKSKKVSSKDIFLYQAENKISKSKIKRSQNRILQYYQNPSNSVLIKITNQSEIIRFIEELMMKISEKRFEIESKNNFSRNIYPEFDMGVLGFATAALAFKNWSVYTYMNTPENIQYMAGVNLLFILASSTSLKKVFDFLDKKVEGDPVAKLNSLKNSILSGNSHFFHYGKTHNKVLEKSDHLPKLFSQMSKEQKEKLGITESLEEYFTNQLGNRISFDLVVSGEGKNTEMYIGMRREQEY